MKKCPFCGANIEDSAQFCLYCMQSLTEKEQIHPYKKKKPQWIIIIVAIIAVFLILVAIWFGRHIRLTNEMPSDNSNLNSTSPLNQTSPADTTPITDPSHVHSYSIENTNSKYQKEPATCTTVAIYYYSCSCGEKGDETFSYGETADHTIITKQGYPATCKTPGLTNGMHCSVCNIVLLSQTQIPVVNHTYDNNQDERCNVCNYIRVLNCNHTKTTKLAAISPTCTASGLTEGKKCSLCEEILTAQTTIAPLGHTTVTDQAIAPTCTIDGKTEGKHCSTCNTILVAQTAVAAKGHSYHLMNIADKFLATEATCLSPATYYYSCICGEKFSDTFYSGEKGAHTPVAIPIIPADCANTGWTEGSKCSVCKNYLKEPTEIPPLGHTFRLEDADPACLTCGAAEEVVIQHPEFPIILNDTIRIDSCTYTIADRIEMWKITFTITYTNISSGTTTTVPRITLKNAQRSDSGGNYTLLPNQSGTYWQTFYMDKLFSAPHELVFE